MEQSGIAPEKRKTGVFTFMLITFVLVPYQFRLASQRVEYRWIRDSANGKKKYVIGYVYKFFWAL